MQSETHLLYNEAPISPLSHKFTVKMNKNILLSKQYSKSCAARSLVLFLKIFSTCMLLQKHRVLLWTLNIVFMLSFRYVNQGRGSASQSEHQQLQTLICSFWCCFLDELWPWHFGVFFFQMVHDDSRRYRFSSLFVLTSVCASWTLLFLIKLNLF